VASASTGSCHGDDVDHHQAMDELMPPEPVMPTDGQLDFDGEAEENQIKIITWRQGAPVLTYSVAEHPR
jgi:hypothetical protein